jgi:hypothetical protein
MGKKEGRKKKIGNEIDIQGLANMYTNNETKKNSQLSISLLPNRKIRIAQLPQPNTTMGSIPIQKIEIEPSRSIFV